MSDLLELVWDRINERVTPLEATIDELRQDSQVARSAYAFPQTTLANAPLAADGMTTAEMRFITDGRKGGESAGNGTGVPAYYDPTSDSWLNFYDNAAVVT